MLTRTKSLISLLTTPVVLSLSTSALQFETNAIHDNGATILLCSQEVADTIGLDGESRPLGLAVFGNPNQVQQAFKTTVAIADAGGNHIGNAVVHVVDEFVKVRAVQPSGRYGQLEAVSTANKAVNQPVESFLSKTLLYAYSKIHCQRLGRDASNIVAGSAVCPDVWTVCFYLEGIVDLFHQL
jgi:hypothetical protein